ncbi:hypothetical protein B296_00010235 [Ensete ventricosum]|uniref:Uncharacterized protein n=1 Tax=Ensete ventricosum TaxID=4639 RepID=A0A426ZTQ6_ENSVE|nr:hypothetical protein B296_00010235 [Ensete ventricosum]
MKVGAAYGGGVATCMLSTCRGGWPRPGYLQGGDRLWPRPPAKGRPAAAKASSQYHGQTAGAAAQGWSAAARHPQGATAAHGHAARAAAKGLQIATRDQSSRGGRLQVWHPLECSLRAEAPLARAAGCNGGYSQDWSPAGAALAGAAPVEVSATRVVAPWQSGYWWARAVAAS